MSEIYLLAAALKRFEDERRHEEDRPILDYLMVTGRERIAHAFEGVLQNLPARWAAILVRLLAFPAGISRREPPDRLISQLAEMLMTPGAQRERLTVGLYMGEGNEDHAMNDLEEAFELAVAAEPAEKRMREAGVEEFDEAIEKGTITVDEADLLKRARAAHDRVIAVDAFPMEEISPIARQHREPPPKGGSQRRAKKSVARPKRRQATKGGDTREAAE
jgi:acyl-CoA dehydrogenase